MSFGKRTILWLPLNNEIPTEEVTMSNRIQEQVHHIRHHGKHHKLNFTSLRHNQSHQYDTTTASVVQDSVSNKSSIPSTTIRSYINFNSTLDISGSTEDVRQTAICYTTNEVLLIIGLTCILNFAFIVLIMSCVHFCSSANTSKVADLPR